MATRTIATATAPAAIFAARLSAHQERCSRTIAGLGAGTVTGARARGFPDRPSVTARTVDDAGAVLIAVGAALATIAVAMSRWPPACAVRDGHAARTRAAAPATKGAAKLVPSQYR